MPKLSVELDRIKKQYGSNDYVVIGVWTKKDILNRAKKLNMKISNEEANEVLVVLQEDFDPMVGINYKVIDVALRDVADGLDDDAVEDEGDDEIEPVDRIDRIDPEDVAGFYPEEDEKQ